MDEHETTTDATPAGAPLPFGTRRLALAGRVEHDWPPWSEDDNDDQDSGPPQPLSR
jgi:hypothetical protein